MDKNASGKLYERAANQNREADSQNLADPHKVKAVKSLSGNSSFTISN